MSAPPYNYFEPIDGASRSCESGGNNPYPYLNNLESSKVNSGNEASAKIELGTYQVEKGKMVRLKKAETEAEYFSKLLNVKCLKIISLIQALAAGAIFFFQILIYIYNNEHEGTRSYRALDVTGIALWAPLCFFFIASGLTYIATRAPSGCRIGFSIAFQVASLLISAIILIVSAFSLPYYGYSYAKCEYSGYRDELVRKYVDNAEVLATLFCSIIIVGSVVVFITSILAKVYLFKAFCNRGAPYLVTVVQDEDANKV